VRVLVDPVAHRLGRQVERLAHRRSVLGLRIEPDRRFDPRLRRAAVPVVHLLHPLLHALGAVGKVTDGDEPGAGVVLLGRLDQAPDALPVADDADVEVVAHPFLLGAPQHQILQEVVHRIGQHAGPAGGGVAGLLRPAERLLHRRRLVEQEQDCGGLLTANFGGVRHAGGQLGDAGNGSEVASTAPADVPDALLKTLDVKTPDGL